MADFDVILGKDGNGESYGTLKDELKGAPKDFPPGLVRGRVRLPEGSMACAKPSLPYFEKVKFDYQDIQSYEPQFTADLMRFTSKPAGTITLELVSFNGGTTLLELVAVGSAPIHAYVENHNPKLVVEAMKGHINPKDFWAHHFVPYHAALRRKPGGNVVPIYELLRRRAELRPAILLRASRRAVQMTRTAAAHGRRGDRCVRRRPWRACRRRRHSCR